MYMAVSRTQPGGQVNAAIVTEPLPLNCGCQPPANITRVFLHIQCYGYFSVSGKARKPMAVSQCYGRGRASHYNQNVDGVT